jgi:hypothetical protein
MAFLSEDPGAELFGKFIMLIMFIVVEIMRGETAIVQRTRAKKSGKVN